MSCQHIVLFSHRARPLFTSVVSVVLIAFGVAFVVDTGDSIEAEREELSKTWTQADAEEVSNKDWANVNPDDFLITPEEQLQLDLLPTRWQFDGEHYFSLMTTTTVPTTQHVSVL